MTAVDYIMFYKDVLPVDADWSTKAEWEVFVSAFNSSERVQRCFDLAPARQKHWIILPEYQYELREHPVTGDTFRYEATNEADLIKSYFTESRIDLATTRLCIDITGFMRPHVMFFIKFLADAGLDKVDIIYAEPVRYERKEETRFSDEEVTEIRQIAGYEGTHDADNSGDVLIIGSGYDHRLIAQVADSKDNARKIQVFGLPSLRPDMYQENVLRAERAAGAIGGEREAAGQKYYAPANDPFTTASVLSEIVGDLRHAGSPITNLYLSPLATKPQALGFALFYLTELQEQPASIIFPFCRTYSRETSVGLSKVSRYVVELDIARS